VTGFWRRLGIGSAGFAVLAAAIAAGPLGAPRIMTRSRATAEALPENAETAKSLEAQTAGSQIEAAPVTVETQDEPTAPALQPVDFENPSPATCQSEIDRALVGRKILFEHDSARLSQTDRENLLALLNALAACSGLTLIIEGHTDSSGGERANLRVSAKRAKAVADFLEEGAPEVRLLERAYGESRPIASNRTAAGRMTNRRIEFVIEGAAGESE